MTLTAAYEQVKRLESTKRALYAQRASGAHVTRQLRELDKQLDDLWDIIRRTKATIAPRLGYPAIGVIVHGHLYATHTLRQPGSVERPGR